jgi:hypothetical protein
MPPQACGGRSTPSRQVGVPLPTMLWLRPLRARWSRPARSVTRCPGCIAPLSGWPRRISGERPYVGGNEPAPRYRVIYGDGFTFTAAVWLGPHASRAEQHAIWAVVRSLRFPSLQEGTFWQEEYYVLGPASRYPPGSVTAFPAATLPSSPFAKRGGFYLIHAPRAFYVITKVFRDAAPGSSATCQVAFDRKTFQFFCPGTDLRWDRVGEPLGAHAGSGPDWALQLHVATVAQDGHVLFSPFFGGLLPVDLQGNPWR